MPRINALPAIALALVCTAGSAGAEPARWTLRLRPSVLVPGGDEAVSTSPSGGGERSVLSLAEGPGAIVELELRAWRQWGLEVAWVVGEYGVDYRVDGLTDSDDIGTQSYSVGADYHLGDTWHVGGFAVMSTYDDVVLLTEEGRRDKLAFDDDVGFGVKAGFDVPLGDRGAWLATGGLRYSWTILEGEVAGQDLDVDPLELSVGVGRRW